MYYYHNPLPSFCGGMLKFPIFFHRRHFGLILFLLSITSFIFERFPTFCDRRYHSSGPFVYFGICFFTFLQLFFRFTLYFPCLVLHKFIWLKKFWFLLILLVKKSKSGYLAVLFAASLSLLLKYNNALGLFRTMK